MLRHFLPVFFVVLLFSCKGPDKYSRCSNEDFKKKLSRELEENTVSPSTRSTDPFYSKIKSASSQTEEDKKESKVAPLAQTNKSEKNIRQSNIDDNPKPYVDNRRTHSKAKASIMSGIGSFFVLIIPIVGFIAGIVLAIKAISYGISAYKKIKAEPDQFKGRGFAIAGILLGVFVLFLIILIIALIILLLMIAVP